MSHDATPPTPAIVDDARSSAAGTRAAARWMASALAAIPSLAIVGSIVRSPGEGSFDPTELAVGVALAALGAIVGVLGFARVLAPVRLEDSDLSGFDVTRVPGQPFATFADLKRQVDLVRSAGAGNEFQVKRAAQAVAESESEAASAAADAATAAAKAAASPDDQELARESAASKSQAEAMRAKADARSAASKGAATGQAIWTEQLARAEAVRGDVYLLEASDEVARRFKAACVVSVIAVALVAAGVILVGVAPRPKPKDPPAAATTLVTVQLNDAGQVALGCKGVAELTALRVGGTDEAPVLITLPAPGCPSKSVTFPATKPATLGTVTTVKPIETGG